MISLALNVFLWTIVSILAALALRQGRETLLATARDGSIEFLMLLPRLAIGIVGSGFLAALLPEDLVRAWLGENSGVLGLLIGAAAGALVPGGPVVGFAIGATALKSGAALGPVIAFVTGWSLYALQRIFVWELPFMPARIVWLRVLASLPLPILAALGVGLLAAR